MLEDAREANRENDAKHMRRNCELATLLRLPDLTALKRKYPVSGTISNVVISTVLN